MIDVLLISLFILGILVGCVVGICIGYRWGEQNEDRKQDTDR